MKNYLFLLLIACTGLTLQAQDADKDIKKAGRYLGTYNLDPTGSADKLAEALQLADSAIKDAEVKADPSAWQIYGEVFMTQVNSDVTNLVLNPEYKVKDPYAAGKAYKGFSMAAELATKSYQTKDAMKALSAGLQNIYYMGSSLYQSGNYDAAYEAFYATYNGYNLLLKNEESTTFDPAEHEKTLYYSAVCAQQAGKTDIAFDIYKQLVDAGKAEPGVYEALIRHYETSDPALSEKYLKAAREKYPNDQALLYTEINYLLAKGELTSLIDNLNQALEMDPENTSIYVTIGQIYDKMYQDEVAVDTAAAREHFDLAMSYYQQALEKDDKSFDAIYSIGALYYNKAAAYSVELNALADDYTPAGTKKYDAKKAQMDAAFSDAMPFFKQAEMLNPEDLNSLIALKEIYARQNELDLVKEYQAKIDAVEQK